MTNRLLLGLLFCLPARGLSAERAISYEAAVPAPVESVWTAWTTSAGIATFFAPEAHVELRVDGPFEIFMNPFAEPGMKGADNMRILAFQEQRMLSFTWNAPPHLPAARAQRTAVILRFEPRGTDSTIVRLYHVGWGDGGEWDTAYEYFSSAWKRVLVNLQTRFVNGPRDWTEWLRSMREAAPAR